MGTVKKIVWPGPKQVLKSSLIVLATIVVVGLVIYGIDQGLTALFGAGKQLAVSAGEQLAVVDEVTDDADADADAGADEEETEEAETEANEEAEEETLEEETADAGE